jgi:hypothetical protein
MPSWRRPRRTSGLPVNIPTVAPVANSATLTTTGGGRDRCGPCGDKERQDRDGGPGGEGHEVEPGRPTAEPTTSVPAASASASSSPAGWSSAPVRSLASAR